MFSNFAGIKREGSSHFFEKTLLDVFKLDLLDQHGWSKLQNREKHLVADQCGPYLNSATDEPSYWGFASKYIRFIF